ncbi:hypothetical protein OPW39_15600 [Vibrio europaeus]|uniref:hypothetical protein n=1 Tax=Vibrio europaeus TaxID=300876 RepID=UPI00233EBF86|nr:hypothetical protein [Vibrio europaeus]MDC5870232.1 hypothetical protein [Vibrio europaeus]
MATTKGKTPFSDAIENAEKEVLKQCEFLGNGRVMQIALETLSKDNLIVGTLVARYLKEGMKVINPFDANGLPVTILRTSFTGGETFEQDEICFECELGSASVKATDVLFLVSDSIDTNSVKQTVNSERELVNDPSTSFWLKEQFELTKKRDLIDALSDAEILVSVLKSRVNLLLSN